MITYEPGKWSVCFALSLTGSVLPKASVWAFSCSALSCAGHIALKAADIDVNNSVDTRALTLFGGFIFILGFLTVFRAQQAHARWWEGGTLLQQLRGEWFNAFSSLLAFCNQSAEKQGEVEEFKHRLVRLTSLLYSSALQQVTTIEDPKFEVIELDGFDTESMKFLDETHDRCEVVLQWIQRLVVDAHAADIVKIAPPILSRVYNQLGNGIVNLNNARKITDFPMPYPLAQMMSLMLIIHWISIAIMCAIIVDHVSSVAFISFMAEIAYWSVNYIAIELEMPFGDDPNDLPLHHMQRDLNKSLIGLLSKRACLYPEFKMQPHTTSLNTCELDFHTFVRGKERKMNMHWGTTFFNKEYDGTASKNSTTTQATLTGKSMATAVARAAVAEESIPINVETGSGSVVTGQDRFRLEVPYPDVSPAGNSPIVSQPAPLHNARSSSSGSTDKRRAGSGERSTRFALLDAESTVDSCGSVEDSADRRVNMELVKVSQFMEGHLAMVVQELTALHPISLTGLAHPGEGGGDASHHQPSHSPQKGAAMPLRE